MLISAVVLLPVTIYGKASSGPGRRQRAQLCADGAMYARGALWRLETGACQWTDGALLHMHIAGEEPETSTGSDTWPNLDPDFLLS